MNSSSLIAPLRLLKRTWKVARGEDIFFAPQTEKPTVTLGRTGAAWSVCSEHLGTHTVVYSFGVGEEISFERELIESFGVTVHAFDPTPRSIAWVGRQSLPERFVFHPYGIAAQDGVRKFNPPSNRNYVSHTLIDRGFTTAFIELPVHRLSSIMRELGHDRLELLKMDIEGAEYEVIANLVASRLEVEQLLVEFHHRWPEVGVSRTKSAVYELNNAGYRIFNISSSGQEFGFLKPSSV